MANKRIYPGSNSGRWFNAQHSYTIRSLIFSVRRTFILTTSATPVETAEIQTASKQHDAQRRGRAISLPVSILESRKPQSSASLAGFILMAVCVCQLVAIALGFFLVDVLGYSLGSTSIPLRTATGLSYLAITAVVLIAPILETFLMYWIGYRCLPFFWPRVTEVARGLVMSIALASIHGSFPRAIVAFWAFSVFSYVFIKMRRDGTKRAILVTSIVHTLANASSVLLILL